MKHLLLTLLCAGGLAVAGCGSDSDDDGEEGGEQELVEDPDAEACKTSDTPTYDNFAKEFVMTNCLTCHSSAKTGPARLQAPVGLDFDTRDGVSGEAEDVYHEVVVEKAMPVGGGPSDADREKFGVWLSCGAP